MSIHIEQIPLGAALDEREIERLRSLVRVRGRAVLAVPGFGARDVCRRALADASLGVGVEVTTPDGLIQTLWELLGDGRRVASSTQRRLLMARAVEACVAGGAAPALANTPGTVKMLCQVARGYMPFLLNPPEGVALSASERQIARAVAAYAELLEGEGLIESSDAALALGALVRELAPACVGAVVLRGVSELPEHLCRLLEDIARVGEVRVRLGAEGRFEAERLAERFACPVERPDCAPRAITDRPLRFAAVCGPTAREAAYTQIAAAAARALAGAPEAGPIAVASPDPVAAFRALAPRLAATGLASDVSARTAFRDTRAGQALAQLVDLLERIDGEEASAWWPAPEVPDWIRSPFSGLSAGAPRIARMLDTRFRKTRSLTKAMLLDELESLQSRELNRERALAEREGRPRRPVAVKAVIDAVDAGRFSRALQLMRACAASARPAAFGAEGVAGKQAELTALDAALAFMDEAHALGVSERQAYLVLPDLAVRLEMHAEPDAPATAAEDAPGPGGPAAAASSAVVPENSTPDGPAAISFIAMDALAASAPWRYGAAALIDADAVSYPLAERDTPVTLLARKLGCPDVAAKPAERQRALFRMAAEAAHATVLAYVARDRQADERYPALAYAEARAACAAQGGAPARAVDGCARAVMAGLDRALGSLPHEGSFFENLDRAAGAGAAREVVAVSGAHVLPSELDGYLLLPTRSLGSRTVPRTLSASQIENYLSCPYRWLVSNRASSRRLDVEFGPIEMGNFVHDVMQRFHERLIEAGLMRVRPETVDACMVEMDAAFEEIRADHLLGKYTHGKYAGEERPRAIRGPLIPLDELERNRFDAILSKLHEVVRRESDMLSIFTPARFEYSFDKEGVTYAGHPLGGRIDRIDTAPDAGSGERFVVIDYKNRASVRDLGCADPTMALEEGEALGDGWLPGRDADRAPKVQTLIYAQALERALGGSAQGAVYFATRGPEVAGAVSDALVSSEPPAFPHDPVSGYPGARPPRSRTAKHDGTLSFQQMLDVVEASIASELDALEHGCVAPRPASDSCTYCPLTMCEKRR